jgi:hypothetical protein
MSRNSFKSEEGKVNPTFLQQAERALTLRRALLFCPMGKTVTSILMMEGGNSPEVHRNRNKKQISLKVLLRFDFQK